MYHQKGTQSIDTDSMEQAVPETNRLIHHSPLETTCTHISQSSLNIAILVYSWLCVIIDCPSTELKKSKFLTSLSFIGKHCQMSSMCVGDAINRSWTHHEAAVTHAYYTHSYKLPTLWLAFHLVIKIWFEMDALSWGGSTLSQECQPL